MIGVDHIKLALVLGIIMCSTAGRAQTKVIFERQVIGCNGMDALQGNIRFSGNAGEPATASGSGSGDKFTQGFEQPKNNGPLRALFDITPTSCRLSKDGGITITNIYGCEPPYQIQWNNGDTTMEIDNLNAGDYDLTLTTNNCQKTFTVHVPDGETPCPLNFFNSITPNGDGVNDVWRIPNVDLSYYTNNEVQIFNQWGNLVWSGKGYDNSSVVFKGMNSKGEALPAGTYYYLVKIAGDTYKGYLELVR